MFITVLMGYGSTAAAATDRVQHIISLNDDNPAAAGAAVEDENRVVNDMVCEELRGYFVKNSVTFADSFKHVVVSNQKDFEKYFGIARTMNNETDKVNFDENAVIAILTKPSLVTHKIAIIYCDLADGKLTVKYKISEGAENSFKSSGLRLLSIPRSITSVVFKTRYNIELIDVK
jgi:hypothetical protein